MDQKTLIYADWSSLNSDARNECVFYDRNKLYGAYYIRRNYSRLMSMAFLITVGCFILAISSPLIYRLLKGHAEDLDIVKNEVVLDFSIPPPVNPDELPPPPPPPPPVVQQIKFVPPVVVDKQIWEEEQAPLQEELADKNIGTQSIDSGLIEAPPASPVIENASIPTGPFAWVQEMPAFPGGDQKLLEYIQKNLNYPAIARENGIQGRATIRFVVDENGLVKMANVPKGMGIGGGCDEEAIRVIMTLPAWSPGKQNGRAVAVWYTVPVIFKLM